MELTEKQKAARKLTSEYLGYLVEQEALVGRMVDRKWMQMVPRIEQFVDQKIQERLSILMQDDENTKKSST